MRDEWSSDTSHDRQLLVSVSASTLPSLTEKEFLTLRTDRSDKSKKAGAHTRAVQLCCVGPLALLRRLCWQPGDCSHSEVNVRSGGSSEITESKRSVS